MYDTHSIIHCDMGDGYHLLYNTSKNCLINVKKHNIFAGPTQLRWHCFYILIIAVNGITECFMFATMSQAAVEKYNKKMVMFSVIFLLSSWFLTYFGAVGFIFANCLNMMLRIIHR